MSHLRATGWTDAGRLGRAVRIERAGATDDAEYYVYGGAEGLRQRKVTQRVTDVANGTTEEVETRTFRGPLGHCELRVVVSGGTETLSRWTSHFSAGDSRIATLHRWTRDDDKLEVDDVTGIRLLYQLSDHLGSVAIELNDAAELVSLEEYFVYGGTAFLYGDAAREVNLREYRYAGKLRDSFTGFYAYDYRELIPGLGNWLAPEPAGDVDGPNRFAFVGGNPVRMQDVRGLFGTDSLERSEEANAIAQSFEQSIIERWRDRGDNIDGGSEIGTDESGNVSGFAEFRAYDDSGNITDFARLDIATNEAGELTATYQTSDEIERVADGGAFTVDPGDPLGLESGEARHASTDERESPAATPQADERAEVAEEPRSPEATELDERLTGLLNSDDMRGDIEPLQDDSWTITPKELLQFLGDDPIEQGLGAAGFVPFLGEAADVVMFGKDLSEGDYGGATITALSVGIPFIGAGLLKSVARGVADWAKSAAGRVADEGVDSVTGIASGASRRIDETADGPQSADEVIEGAAGGATRLIGSYDLGADSLRDALTGLGHQVDEIADEGLADFVRQLSPNTAIGDIGEAISESLLRDLGIDDITSLRHNPSGHGLDLGSSDAIFEIKTSSVGRPGSPRGPQAHPDDYMPDRLNLAANSEFASDAARAVARSLNATIRDSGTEAIDSLLIRVDLSNGTPRISITNWRRP